MPIERRDFKEKGGGICKATVGWKFEFYKNFKLHWEKIRKNTLKKIAELLRNHIQQAIIKMLNRQNSLPQIQGLKYEYKCAIIQQF